MPYYVFAMSPGAQLERVAEHPVFAAASAQAKGLRASQPTTSLVRIKVVFADTEAQAEDLLWQTRDRPPTGDD
jgi:hypothetical protein